MRQEYRYHTDYFSQPWTWVKRVAEALLVIGFIYWIDLREMEQTSILGVGYIFAGISALYLLLRPMDELALDREKLYYLQKSVIPFFNRQREYKISEIKKINSAGVLTPVMAVGLMPAKLCRSKLEITTKDGLLERRHLTISQREVNKIVAEVSAMMQ